MTLYFVLGLAAAAGLLLWYFYSQGKTSGTAIQQASDDLTADEASQRELNAATQAPGDRKGVVDRLDAGTF